MTDAEIANLTALEKAATQSAPGTWKYAINRHHRYEITYSSTAYVLGEVWSQCVAAFTVDARNALPKLLAERARLIEALEGSRFHHTSHCMEYNADGNVHDVNDAGYSCTCGAAKHNAAIESVLAEVRR